MKGQRIRYQQTGEFHFLTFSCYRRRPYLSTVAAMELFEDALERVRLRYLFAIAGYVVLPEHVHLLMSEPRRALLSKTIQALKLSVTYAARKGPSGRLTITISTSPRTPSSQRSFATFIATRWFAGWSRNLRTGSGRAIATIRQACAEPWRLNRSGQRE